MIQVKGSKLVTNVETLEALAGLLGVRRNSLKLTTLFNAGDSGWSNVSAFHTSCDNKGPTIVLIRSKEGTSYGGYTSVSWNPSGSYQADAQAFLFRLRPKAEIPGSRQQVETEKFPITASLVACAHNSTSSSGPQFGGGHDLTTFDTDGVTLRTKPHSYPTLGPLIDSSVPRNEGDFQLEVLQVVIDPSGTSERDMPWLAGVSWATEVLVVALQLAESNTCIVTTT